MLIAFAGNLPRTLLCQPFSPLQRVQPLAQVGVERMQVAHIVRSVAALRLAQRPAQPVRTGFALFQRDTGHLLHQSLVAHPGADPAQGSGSLCIEQRLRQGITSDAQGLEVLSDRKSTRLNSSHYCASRMPSYA